MTDPLKCVPLHARHVEHGARMVPFAGFHMPLQYAGLTQEHHAVRQRVGLFDVSHMGEIEVRGEDAIALVNRIVTHDVTTLVDGQALYTVMCHKHGGVVDDLLVYRLERDHLLLCVNAANRDKDFAHITRHATGVASIEDTGDSWAQLALQGPEALALLSELTDTPLEEIAYFHAVFGQVAGARALISRTGYTGEDGFELYIQAADAVRVFDALMEHGGAHGLELCGLGCRDTLRLEAKLHLYGQDLDDETNPYEAGLSWVVKLDKGDFVGRQALREVKAQGPARRLRALTVTDRGVIRQGYEVMLGDKVIGEVTSGSYSPTLETSIGLAYIDIEHVREEQVEIAVRKRRLEATMGTQPFYVREQA